MARRSSHRENAARDRLGPPAREPQIKPPPAWLTLRVRLLITAAIIYHLIAVFIGAWIGSPPTSPLADEVARPFRAYIGVADLNHGYRFFAPNPGPSHLFRYRLSFDDGSEREGYFPNRAEHWPRLLYHRYFMLAENLNTLMPNGLMPDERASPDDEARGAFLALAGSYAGEILRTTGAARIDWDLARHYQPPPAAVLGGQKLVDKGFYVTVDRGTLTREELR